MVVHSKDANVGTTAPDRLLTPAEFGRETNTSERFARRLIQERRVRFVKIGRFVRIPHSAILELIAEGTVHPLQGDRDRGA